MIGKAFEVALLAHQGQTDKSGAPHIGHVVRVCANVQGEEARIVALLHDVVEDTDITLKEIRDQFGAKIAKSVDALTKRQGEAVETYLKRVASDKLAITSEARGYIG
jgi:(p)ppGpp synthase/HD superfamily hydrolase